MFHESFQKYKVLEYLSKFITNWAKLQNQTVHYSVHYDVWQCNVLEYNDAITKPPSAIVPTLKRFLSCFTFDKVPEFLFLVRDYCIRVIIKSVTDSIKELLSRKEWSPLCHFWTLSVAKKKWNVNTCKCNMKKNRTCGAQLLLTYFHTRNLLKVATNCLKLISQECAG